MPWSARPGLSGGRHALPLRDLDVEVLAPDGRRVAYDTGEDRWPIVEPDRPFCAFEAGEYRAVVRAQRGAGRYALAIHELVED